MGKKTVTGMLLALLIFSILAANMITVAAQEKHDVAVVSVTPSATLVEKGNVVNITVVIENQGTVAEDVTVKVYRGYDPAVSVPIETKTVSALGVGENVTENFTWDTTHVLIGTHTITAVLPELPSETDTDDNTLRSDETVTVLSDAVYIRPNGSIDPPTAPISTVDNVTYTFSGNIYDEIVVERDNIVVDGAGYTVQGPGVGKGIHLTYGNNVTIKKMEIKAFDDGIWISGSSNCNSISENSITNNNYDGIFVFSSDNSISENNITNNNRGIMVLSSSNNNICRNNITVNNYRGIWFEHSSNNNVFGNFIANNWHGILLLHSSGNIISENNIIANIHDGISLYESSNNNTISKNNVANNEFGIWIVESSDNSFSHNNFIININQTHSAYCVNVWDDGYPSGGNYWSDYTGVDDDGDGIGDTPYVIDENNQDDYPLMNPWSLKPPSPVEATQELIETIETWDLSKGAENSLTSKLDNIIHQLNKGNENVAINKLIVLINQVEALRDKKLTSDQADYLIAEAQRIIDLING